MGCDIHLYAEKKKDGKWVTADKWQDNPDWNEEAKYERKREIKSGYRNGEEDERFYTDGRNYNLFCALAGARSHHFAGEPSQIAEAKGMPPDACPETLEERECWGSDGHTDSWLTLREIKAFDWTSYGDTCNAFREEVIPKMEAIVAAEGITEDDVRIVFWFDN